MKINVLYHPVESILNVLINLDKKSSTRADEYRSYELFYNNREASIRILDHYNHNDNWMLLIFIAS